MPDDTIMFGPFRLIPSQQLLLEGEQPVRLSSRALDILCALVEQPGQLVTKDELMARVWPSTHVEEINLRVHIAALRRTLGDGRGGQRYLSTIPGRGYQFVAPVSVQQQQQGRSAAVPLLVDALPRHNLPASLTRVIGRADTIRDVLQQLSQNRLVSIVGPGGIGKTTVAVAAAERVAKRYPDGVRFVDLSPISDETMVPAALAATLEVAVRSNDPLPDLSRHLRDRTMLLVLDNCEHVVDAVATLAVRLLRDAPGVGLLATSREPLRADGEQVLRLPPLELPPARATLTAAEALQYPAVDLFVERAAASLEQFQLLDADAPVVADICRRLDGIALAIEMAASRVDAFGVHGLAALLSDRFRLLARGRRTAQPRQQTLAAALDWSHGLLSEPERGILRRLGVFVGEFSLEGACAVAAETGMTLGAFAELLANLVAKSLVAAEISDSQVHYRLLETTRAYALQKLTASGELGATARRHAAFLLCLFERASAEWESLPADEWQGLYGRQLDNMRAALDWAFAADVALAEALTLSAMPLWMHLSLMDECRGRMEQALAGWQSGRDPDRRRQMQLYSALGLSLMYTKGPVPETAAALRDALAIAEVLGDIDNRLRALWGLWVYDLNNGAFRDSLELARQFQALAGGSRHPVDQPLGDRMLGFSLHFLGDQVTARQHLEQMLTRFGPAGHRLHMIRFQFDQRVTAAVTLAEVLWLLGLPDQAMQLVEQNVEDARAIDHAVSLCNTLAKALPVAVFCGDLDAAERYAGMLAAVATQYGLSFWQAEGLAFSGLITIRRGDLAQGLAVLERALEQLPQIRFVLRYTAFLGDYADALAQAGQHARATTVIETALQRCERNEEYWCRAELLRIKGEVVRAGDPALAEACFQQALEHAGRQQALAWELRSAQSLARLRMAQGQRAEALALLQPIYARFAEGFGTCDLVEARALLDELTA